MKLIKLTPYIGNKTLWINTQKITAISKAVNSTNTCIRIDDKIEYLVCETPEQIMELIAQDNQSVDTIFKAQTRAALDQIKEDIELLQEAIPKPTPGISCQTCRNTQDYAKPPCDLCNTYSRWQQKEEPMRPN